MKKIIALMLALVCVFALASCGGEPENDYSDLDVFKTAVDNTVPTSASVRLTMETNLSDEPMVGQFNVAYNEDGSATVEYSYDQFVPITQGGPTEERTQVTGTATIDKDGNVTDGEVNTSVTAATLVDYNLDGAKMDYSVEVGVLTATVAAADTEDVLGVKIDSDVTFTLTVANERVVSVTITYTTAQGLAQIITTYN